jgi:hypothetical protein
MTRGIDILEESIGSGEEIKRHQFYQISLRIWLHKGDPVVWKSPWGSADSFLSDDGQTLTSYTRIDREYLFGGLFYGIQGMRIGGRRLLEIAPHLAYRERGVEGVIPPNALLKVEVSILAERPVERSEASLPTEI